MNSQTCTDVKLQTCNLLYQTIDLHVRVIRIYMYVAPPQIFVF